MNTARSRFAICEASLDDCQRIQELSSQLGYETRIGALQRRLLDSLASEYSIVLLAIDSEDRIAGFTEVGENRSLIDGIGVQLLALVVDDQTRRQGVGRLLVDAACGWARDRGHTRIGVRSNAIREEAHKFYPGLGFSLKKTQHVYELRI